MKKKIIPIVSALLVIAFVLGWKFLILHDENHNTLTKTQLAYSEAVKEGKIVHGESSYRIDANNLNALVGIQDYVFVGKLIKDEGTYKPLDPLQAGVPWTTFKVKVIQNLKGQLSTSKPIKIYKNVGPLQNGEFYIDNGDIYPEKGNYYIFSLTVTPDSSTLPQGVLAGGGLNSNVLLDKNEAIALKSNKVKDFQNAVVNQTAVDRGERGKIVDSEVYLNEPLDQ